MIDWLFIHEHFDWLGHMVEAVVMAAIVFLITRVFADERAALLMGMAFAAGHFHGREKRDYEISVSMPPPHIEGYFMWRWSWDQMTDFWPVAILMLIAAWYVAKRWK